MLRKTVLLALIVIATAFMGSCTKPTKLIGTLLLQPGQTGDVQNSRVELWEKGDLSGTPIAFVKSLDKTSSESPFEFADILEDNYFIVAWKDLDGDAAIGDKDIVGVHEGVYKPGFGGSVVTVTKGKTTDVGDIEMMIYKVLKISASGSRSADGLETTFTYSFNYDLNLAGLTITFPVYGAVPDNTAPGAKTTGTQYTSGPWWDQGGAQMPTGDHVLNFTGTWEGAVFDVDVIVNIN